jgi:hypothetical protein
MRNPNLMDFTFCAEGTLPATFGLVVNKKVDQIG